MDHSSTRSSRRRGAVLLGYMAASSSMLLVNKLIITDFPCPFFTLACQFGASAALARISGWWNQDESLTWSSSRAVQFAPAAIAQVATIYTGIHSLQYVNVETFITARASTPILISAVEYTWMGRQLPSLRSMLCLLGMLVGSLFYGLHDLGGDPRGYLWLALWYVVFCFDQTYLKGVLERLGSTSSTTAGVYYTNLLGLAVVLVGGQVEAVTTLHPSATTLGLLMVSCLLGVVLATTAMESRRLTTPTQFAIMGNVCKLITIASNWIIWEHHCSVESLMGLFLSLLSASQYAPSPRREDVVEKQERV